MIRRAYPTDLSDDEWACLEPYLPTHVGTGRPRVHSLRGVEPER
jgi:transposase